MLAMFPGVKNKQKLHRDSSSTTMDKFCGRHKMYYSVKQIKPMCNVDVYL